MREIFNSIFVLSYDLDNISHTHSLSNLMSILEEKLMTRQLKMYFKGGNGMSDNGNNLPEIPFGNRDDANVMASQALQQWAEQFYAKMVEEKQAEEAPSMMDQLMEKAGEYVDQKIEELPPEEQEAAEMRLMETVDALVDTIDKAYTVTDKA